MAKRILLIGGGGYIGSVVAQFLLKKKYNVTCFDSFIYNNEKFLNKLNKYKNYRVIKSDIRNKKNILKAIKKSTDIVLLAGLVGDPITKKYPIISKKINEAAIIDIIKICKNCELDKVIFVSTCSNYGLLKSNKLADEKTKLSPLSLYAKSKVVVEKFLLSQKNKVTYKPVILRFATAFGLSPRMRFDLTVNEFVKEIYLKNKLIVYDADTWRPYCHVNDFAKLIELVLNTDSKKVSFEVFNAGGNRNNYRKKDIVDGISKFLPIHNVFFESKGSDRRNYKVNFKKVENKLNFKTDYSLELGIQEIIKYLKEKKPTYFKKNKNNLGNYIIQSYKKLKKN